MKIRCTTSFDITATGVTGHCKPSRLPFQDRSGQMITNEQEWNDNFWNNSNEFPNDNSVKSNLRMMAFETAKKWFEVIEKSNK